MIRELVLDTETTGFAPENGDKIVEIGIVELINYIPSGKNFHKYLNPQRPVPESAFKVHGPSYDFLKDKPLFSNICDELLEFIGRDKIIIHNATFDLGFLNNELSIHKKDGIPSSQVIDTLLLAREKFPGSPASLDALCRRFSIDNSNRQVHGALLDSYILAQVYLELIGGSQPNFELGNKTNANDNLSKNGYNMKTCEFYRNTVLPKRVTREELNDHKMFIKKIGGIKNWPFYN